MYSPDNYFVIGQIYKHDGLKSVMQRINNIPTLLNKLSIKGSPKDKTDNQRTLANFLERNGFFDIFQDITQDNINAFIELLQHERQYRGPDFRYEEDNNSHKEVLNLDDFESQIGQGIGQQIEDSSHNEAVDLSHREADSNPVIPKVTHKRRAKRRNKTRNQNFSTNQMEEQQQQRINPLEAFVGNTLTVTDLLNIYNKYCPEPLTMQQVYDNSHGDEDYAKAHLIEEILRAAREGYLVGTRNGGFGGKKGMDELYQIVINLQKDVKRVANAISPQGAEYLVQKHNESNPRSPWYLNKKDPNQPASLQNLTDENQDGIPDVVIRNHNNQLMYVNGYTTKKSDYPLALHYYNMYPTREDRSGISKKDFKKQLFDIKYVDDGDDPSAYGNVQSWSRVPAFANYNMKGYAVKEPKRLSAYQRFMKYIIGDVKDEAFGALEHSHINIPSTLRLAVLSKAASSLWNKNVLQPIYERYGAVNEVTQKKVKKAQAGEIDNTVTNIIRDINNLNSPVKTQITNELIAEIRDIVGE